MAKPTVTSTILERGCITSQVIDPGSVSSILFPDDVLVQSVTRITEAGDRRITEDGDVRVTEGI